MIFDEFPIPLTFYDDKSKQNRFKENAGNVDVFDLWAISDRLLPFQFRADLGANINSIVIFNDDEDLVLTLDKTAFLSEAVSEFQYFTWFSDQALKTLSGAFLKLPCGKFYLQVNFDISDPLYSEVFTIMDNPNNYFFFEWTNSIGDIDPVYYGSGYKNRLYLDTFITKGVPSVELDTEKDGFGNTVVISKRMINNYDLSLSVAPNFILDAVNFMALHDAIIITTKQLSRSGYIENVTVDQDQVNLLALWEITIKFNQPQFFFSGSCPTPITPPEVKSLIINAGHSGDLFDLIYDAN